MNNRSFKEISNNIDQAHKFCKKNSSVNIAVLVSGNEKDKNFWQDRLSKTGQYIFNKDASTKIISLEEKIGAKTTEGNFLGTLLAYQYIKEETAKNNIDYQNSVIMIGMLFGRGERMSPITQCKACRKPAIEVSPESLEIDGRKEAFTAIEEALMYFAPIAKNLENQGFYGILDKWGDETQIASCRLNESLKRANLPECDVIKFVSIVEITEEKARQKDWIVFNENNDLVEQFSRGDRNKLVDQLKNLGIKPVEDNKYCAGISLGPVAISYKVLDIAEKIFDKEIKEEGVKIDFDPYFIMALAMDDRNHALWIKRTEEDNGLKELLKMMPDFFEKVQAIKKEFENTYNRALNLKVFDLGSDIYWADIGQHNSMREKFMSLNEDSSKGNIARGIASIPNKRDRNGNIIVNSDINKDIIMTDSVIVNSKVLGKGKIDKSVIIDSRFRDIEAKEAFSVRSYRLGDTSLSERSGLLRIYWNFRYKCRKRNETCISFYIKR